MKLYLDDIRDPSHNYGYEGKDWIVFRDADSFLKAVIENDGKIEAVSLDHDLGSDVPDGAYVLDKIEEGIMSGTLKGPEQIFIHTGNPVEAKNMVVVVKRIYEFRGQEV